MERVDPHHPIGERKSSVRLITAHVENTPQQKMKLKCLNHECLKSED